MPSPHITITQANPASANLFDKVSDLAAGVVIQFRETVRLHCVWAHSIGSKLSHARHALKSFQAHVGNGTFPPAIEAIRTPLCQTSKEVMEAEDVKFAVAALTSSTQTHKSAMLQTFIKIKDDEVAHLNSLLSQGPERFRAAVEAQWATISEGLGGEDSTLQAEKDKLLSLAKWYTLRAQQIAATLHDIEITKRMKKLELQSSTKEQVMDVDTQVTVKKAVDLALAKYKKDQKSKKGQNKRKRQDAQSKPSKRLKTNAQPVPKKPKGPKKAEGKGKGKKQKKK